MNGPQEMRRSKRPCIKRQSYREATSSDEGDSGDEDDSTVPASASTAAAAPASAPASSMPVRTMSEYELRCAVGYVRPFPVPRLSLIVAPPPPIISDRTSRQFYIKLIVSCSRRIAKNQAVLQALGLAGKTLGEASAPCN